MDVAFSFLNPYITDIIRQPSNSTGTATVYEMYLPQNTDWPYVEENIKSAQSGSALLMEELTSRALYYYNSAFQFRTHQLTSTVIRNYEMSLLEKIASLGEENLFSRIADSFDWASFTVQDLVNILQLALGCGAHLQARKLATYGGNHFPENEVMQKFARVLGPTTIIDSNLPADPAASADMQWLKTNSEKYRGEWVALRSGVLFEIADTRKELLAKINKPKDKKILITQVY